jgi:Domain of unknown function (DUF4351)
LNEGICRGLEQIVLEDLQAHLGVLKNKTVKQIQQLAPYQINALQQQITNFDIHSDLNAWMSEQ